MTRQVLRGLAWEDTFTGNRGEGGLSFIRTQAVPCGRGPARSTA